MDMVSFIMLTKMSMKGSGLMIKQMEKVFIHIIMELNIMENGKMTSNMVLEWKVGQMELYMKDQ